MRYFHTGYVIFQRDSVKYDLNASLNHNEICRIPYENASRTGVRVLPIDQNNVSTAWPTKIQ